MVSYNKEIRNRILISVYAYAYEFRNESLIDDKFIYSIPIRVIFSIITFTKKIIIIKWNIN